MAASKFADYVYENKDADAPSPYDGEYEAKKSISAIARLYSDKYRVPADDAVEVIFGVINAVAKNESHPDTKVLKKAEFCGPLKPENKERAEPKQR